MKENELDENRFNVTYYSLYNYITKTYSNFERFSIYNWRPPSLSELTPVIPNMKLTHLGTEASNYYSIVKVV